MIKIYKIINYINCQDEKNRNLKTQPWEGDAWLRYTSKPIFMASLNRRFNRENHKLLCHRPENIRNVNITNQMLNLIPRPIRTLMIKSSHSISQSLLKKFDFALLKEEDHVFKALLLFPALLVFTHGWSNSL